MQKIDDAAAAAGRSLELLVQVDLAGEATKHGAREADLPAIFEAARGCTAVRLIGAHAAAAGDGRPRGGAALVPRAARAARSPAGVAASTPGCLAELSMGMSHDFEVAIEEGATMVRVGTAIFGSRTLV